MKRKLIIGFVLITVIFVISGAYINSTLSAIHSKEKLIDDQEKMMDDYREIMFDVKSAQAELYRHAAGFSGGTGRLRTDFQEIEDMLSSIRRHRRSRTGNTSCNSCHFAGPKVDSMGKRFDEASFYISRYEEAVGAIFDAKHLQSTRNLDREAADYAGEVLSIIKEAKQATAEMIEAMELRLDTSARKADFSVAAAIVLSLLAVAAVVIWLVRSITGPVNRLVAGIEKVSSGDYGSKVDVVSADEMGFLADKFNAMTGKLDKMTREKDVLMGELQQLNDSLDLKVREATEELKRTHEQMLRTQTLSAVGTLASGVAHELATPLGSILNYVRIMRRRSEGGGGTAAEMDIIEKELIRCRDILRGMLSFVRAPEKEKRLTDVNCILGEVIGLTGYEAKAGKISVKEDLAPSLPSIQAVPGQLKQVFLNIMMNAIQSMPEGGQLDISTSAEEEGGNIIVKISDTGCGIPGADMNRIFEPFYTSKNEGTGLGLSVSYGIIKGHGGDVEVESEEGKGTTFVISLPVSVGSETEKEKTNNHRRDAE